MAHAHTPPLAQPPAALPCPPTPSLADECLLLGTSGGYLQLHSAASGALLLRQQLHHSPAVAAAVRWGGSGTDPDDLSEDVTVAFVDAVVRLPGWEVWAAVKWHESQAGRGSHWWSAAPAAAAAAAGGGSPHQLAFSKFSLPRGTGGGELSPAGCGWQPGPLSSIGCFALPACTAPRFPAAWRTPSPRWHPPPLPQASAPSRCAWARRRPACMQR